MTRKLALLLLFAACLGCSEGPSPDSSVDNSIPTYDFGNELLIPISTDRKRFLESRNALELQSLESLAIPGKFDIYGFDINVLSTKDDYITFTPFDGPPIKIMSYGFEPQTSGTTGHLVWRGAISRSGSSDPAPVSLAILVRSIDTDGNIRLPDPNREVTRALYDRKVYTVLEDSVNRLSERIVYSLPGNEIYVPDTNTKYVITALVNQFDFAIVYEVDEADN